LSAVKPETKELTLPPGLICHEKSQSIESLQVHIKAMETPCPALPGSVISEHFSTTGFLKAESSVSTGNDIYSDMDILSQACARIFRPHFINPGK